MLMRPIACTYWPTSPAFFSLARRFLGEVVDLGAERAERVERQHGDDDQRDRLQAERVARRTASGRLAKRDMPRYSANA